MTFAATETSALLKPIEFITFTNGAQNWHYTNSNVIEQIGATSYSPLAYRRTNPSSSKDSNDANVKITIPGNIPLLQLYETLPTSSITSVTIQRRHDNDPDGGVQIFWRGQVASIVRNDQFAELLAVPFTQLPAQIPRYSYSSLCNWFLFQDRCGLVRDDFRHITTVASIQSPTILTLDGIRAQAALIDAGITGSLNSDELDEYWLAGYIETDSGEKRSIFQGNVDSVPDRVRILQPFRDLQVNDSVTVYAGCSRTRDICKRKFDNALRHGGFPDIPDINPFSTELPSGAGDTDHKIWFGN